MKRIIKGSVIALCSVFGLAVGFHDTRAEKMPVVYHIEDSAEEAFISEEDVKLTALVTMAEAESESEYGKRLVIDTIFNRVDSPDYPDAISDVIYQPKQFSVFDNGRIDRCFVSEDICSLVREEFYNRTNSEVIFFNSTGYSRYGTALFKEGRHYFSKKK